MVRLVKRISRHLPRNEQRERLVLRSSLAAGAVAAVVTPIGVDVAVIGVIMPAVFLGIVATIVLYVRRLPRLVIAGAVGGGLTGLLAIGVGARLAMRIVALMGGPREVTVEGTMFLLIAGGMVGATFGVAISLALRAWRGLERPIGIAVGLVLFSGLILDSEVFEEMLHVGAGGWVNFPLFLSFLMAFGLMAPVAIGRVEERLPGRGRPRQQKVEMSRL